MSDVLSAEEIEALLGALSKGDISFDGGGNDCKNGDMNFRRDPIGVPQGTPNSALDADSRIKMLEEEKINIDAEIQKISADYPNCPECGCRYRFGSYLLSIVSEELRSSEEDNKGMTKSIFKKIIYAECPRGHKIRLGENLWGIKKDEVLSQEQIDKLVTILNEIDYGYME